MPKPDLIALRFQAAYYVVTGAWPLLSRRTFEAITGRKTDWWLVQMVGLLALGNGIALGCGTRRWPVSVEARALAMCSAIAFALVDVIHVARRTISPIYLGDAAVEAALIAVLLWPVPGDRSTPP